MKKEQDKITCHRFEYYIRQCKNKECNEFFKASTKLRRYCPECKEKINKLKIKNSLIARGIYVEVNICKMKGGTNGSSKPNIKLISNK